jgi:hypothetical protein
VQQKGEVTIVEERAIIRQRFRFEATWSRRGREDDIEEWETAEEAVSWARNRAPCVIVRTSSPSQTWSAGERDPRGDGPVLPRWPSQTETVGHREPDAVTAYGGIVRIYESPNLVFGSDRYFALWHESGGPQWGSDKHFAADTFTTLYEAIDWGRLRSKVVTVHRDYHPTPYAAGEEQADGQSLPTWPPWPEPPERLPNPGDGVDHFTTY